jgi:uncharacterized protein (TIGR02001 family)
LRYNYPGTYGVGVTKADTDEVYGALTYSIVTAKLSYALGDTFGVSKAQGTTYFELNVAYPFGDSGYAVGAHYGVQTYKGATADAFKAAATDPTYSDYKVSATKDFSGYVVGLAYSGTNASDFYTVATVAGNKKLGDSKVVASLSRAF